MRSDTAGRKTSTTKYMREHMFVKRHVLILARECLGKTPRLLSPTFVFLYNSSCPLGSVLHTRHRNRNIFFWIFETWYSRNDCKPQSKMYRSRGNRMFSHIPPHAAYIGLLSGSRYLLLAFQPVCNECATGHITACVCFLL